ncbi:MAG: c-type cytochrome [Zoogloeaceae bacterium]|nr:c-type cytochrome [Zoogloeaceae bacterium]
MTEQNQQRVGFPVPAYLVVAIVVAVIVLVYAGLRVSGVIGGKAAAPSTAPSAAPVVAPTPAPAAGNGKKIYDALCVTCHAVGIVGAPKFGDKAAWAPRLATGLDALVASALKGKGVMPPKGGNPSIPDADIRAAVEYMTAAAK